MRLAPPSTSERAVAHHEAGHFVIGTVLEGHPGYVSAAIWPDTDAQSPSWSGFTRFFDRPNPQAVTFPDRQATSPHVWDEAAARAWSDLISTYAGPAALRHLFGDTLDAQAVRYDESAVMDEQDAQKAAAHFWPADRGEEVLDAAAHIAGELVQIAPIWQSIKEIADHIAAQVWHKAHAAELELILRRYVSQSIPCPSASWAVGLAR